MKFETEHGCVVSEMATAYGNSEQIGRYAIAAAMNEVLTQAERVDQMEIRVCAPLEEKKTHLYDVKAEAARCAREHGQTILGAGDYPRRLGSRYICTGECFGG